MSGHFYRNQLLLLCATLLFPLGCAVRSVRPFPDPVDRWHAAAPPHRSEQALLAANNSRDEWFVFIEDGAVCVRRYSGDDVVRGPTPPFPLPTSEPQSYGHTPAEKITCKVEDDWLVGYFAGEFGGSLWWCSEDGSQSYKISRDKVRAFVRALGGLYVAQGLAHLNLSKGSIQRVRRDPTSGKWVSERFAELDQAPERAIADSRGNILVVGDDLMRVDREGHVAKILTEMQWGLLYPNSMVMTPDDTLYVGMRKGVARITSVSSTPRLEWFEPDENADQEDEAADEDEAPVYQGGRNRCAFPRSQDPSR